MKKYLEFKDFNNLPLFIDADSIIAIASDAQGRGTMIYCEGGHSFGANIGDFAIHDKLEELKISERVKVHKS